MIYQPSEKSPPSRSRTDVPLTATGNVFVLIGRNALELHVTCLGLLLSLPET